MNKYRNHDIQNEILSLMSNIVVRNIIVELMSTLMSTDECTAASYLEQLCASDGWTMICKHTNILLGFTKYLVDQQIHRKCITRRVFKTATITR